LVARYDAIGNSQDGSARSRLARENRTSRAITKGIDAVGHRPTPALLPANTELLIVMVLR
jgi:hypothetical protein